MERLVQILVGHLIEKNKIWYMLCAIAFWEFPRVVMIYTWDRDAFLSIDAVKLIVFAFAVGFMLCCASLPTSLIIGIGYSKTPKKNMEIIEILIAAIIINTTMMLVAVVMKFINPDMLFEEFFKEFVIYNILIVLVDFIVRRKNWFLYKKRNGRKQC